MRYLFWVIGIIVFAVWGIVAIVRPEALFATFRRHAQGIGGIPTSLERWLSSKYFRVEFRIWGAVSVLIALFLFWHLMFDLLAHVS